MQNSAAVAHSLTPRPLKRSASPASVVQTPHRKRKREGPKRLSLDSCGDQDVAKCEVSGDERLLRDAEDEEWFGRHHVKSYSVLASPPLSHRKAGFSQQTSRSSPPSSPPRCNSKFPIARDSPKNPFLASPLSTDEVIVKEPDSRERSPLEEQPTVLFVLCE